MRRNIVLTTVTLAITAAALSACNEGYGGPNEGWGPQPYYYDAWYDGYYGPIYDGYWGTDGVFYFRQYPTDRQFMRADSQHFRSGSVAPGRTYQRFQGSIPTRPQGTAMPHFPQHSPDRQVDRHHSRQQ